MISILVVSHGNFAKSLVTTAEMIAGKQEQVGWVSLAANDGVDSLSDKVASALADFPEDTPTLILADLWGGSPFNAAAQFAAKNPQSIALVAGVNLPILLEAYMARNSTLSELVNKINEIADDSIRQFEVSTDNDDDLGDDL
ncbi:PTS sugar transporter subunit IIA [Lentilactobacillus buchneri]|uniref:PTS system, mannose-specific IIA component n=1 Tax=Lentilactobacillus buchneri subsp. silagei CD034 TaxID=1071400 RepID=J9W231_LENBU|nr:PTS sugar transporter subunit IIA [Lentilactobacillus buchneri]MCC6099969.1 PTS sugar transporter subunit IIA [Lactobacillus sp.]AFS00568.1 PTS system, mannose-specific IIA component [Lentilactobacillus buchneri subsp. silagei CD034]MCT2900052.1 PTS sugar transporter subunit IIA [Lentilactobacillus buchneri]MCT3542681.1 PTS sugar transporter subunit IIA [Lentilactobacillus buchneri]MCT3544709.1 PTS sugar transporter subunit IIA [Lentilactobacillus buchneri]